MTTQKIKEYLSKHNNGKNTLLLNKKLCKVTKKECTERSKVEIYYFSSDWGDRK